MSNATSTTRATVAGMTCGHCVAAVREEVGALAGVSTVDVELESGAVTITSVTPLDEAALRARQATAAERR